MIRLPGPSVLGLSVSGIIRLPGSCVSGLSVSGIMCLGIIRLWSQTSLGINCPTTLLEDEKILDALKFKAENDLVDSIMSQLHEFGLLFSIPTVVW